MAGKQWIVVIQYNLSDWLSFVFTDSDILAKVRALLFNAIYYSYVVLCQARFRQYKFKKEH